MKLKAGLAHATGELKKSFNADMRTLRRSLTAGLTTLTLERSTKELNAVAEEVTKVINDDMATIDSLRNRCTGIRAFVSCLVLRASCLQALFASCCKHMCVCVRTYVRTYVRACVRACVQVLGRLGVGSAESLQHALCLCVHVCAM